MPRNKKAKIESIEAAEIARIEKNAENRKEIDFYTASVIESMIFLETQYKSIDFKKAFEKANTIEKNAFICSVIMLHNTAAEVAQALDGDKYDTETAEAIEKHIDIIGEYMTRVINEANEEGKT